MNFEIVRLNCSGVRLVNLNLTQKKYNGFWFRIAYLGPAYDYLPQNMSASLISLFPDANNIKTMEFYESDNVCYGPLNGTWIRQEEGFRMQLNRTGRNESFNMTIKIIFHEYSSDDNEEMNIVLYGCRVFQSNGECKRGEEMASILSNSRYPQTLPLFKSAKHLEDNACIDIIRLKTLNTYRPCGDEVVDFDQKLENSLIDIEGEIIENECKVKNFPRKPIAEFFDEPRMLTVTAFFDPILANEDISHISCLFSTKYDAICEYIRHQTCYKSVLNHYFSDAYTVESSINIQLKNESSATVDLSGVFLWHNGDEYITFKCIDINEDGTCDQHRIYVWSDEDLMDQPTIRTIYDELNSICADPTDLIFLNTFRECGENDFIKPPSVKCGALTPWKPVRADLLHGVWFFAADINSDPKIYIQSAVVNLTPVKTSKDKFEIEFFAQLNSDLSCIGPGSGIVQLTASNSTLTVKIDYKYEFLQRQSNSSIQWQNQILYLDNQRMLLYWCFKHNHDGLCLQYDVDILLRSRYLAHHDLSLLDPYLKAACVHQDQLRWFDLHSLCGIDMSQSTSLRRMIMTLTHREVLDILTNVQEPRCRRNQLKGKKVDLFMIEKVGKWFLMSHHDRQSYITFAMIGRLTVVGSGSAIVKVYQSAARPGFAKRCFRRMFVLIEQRNDDDYSYYAYAKSLSGFNSYMIIRFLFLNRHVGVLYSCLSFNKTGECTEKFLYVLSRHDSIDHAELTVLERIANSICLPVEHLTHVSVHDACVYDNHNIKLGTLMCSSITKIDVKMFNQSLFSKHLKERYENRTLFAIASSISNQTQFLLRFTNGNVKKIFERDGKCDMTNAIVQLASETEMLVLVNNVELVLLSAFGLTSSLIIQRAQFSGEYPCLHPVIRDARMNSCPLLQKRQCDSNRIQIEPSKIEGLWILRQSLHRTVAKLRCSMAQENDETRIKLVCGGESTDGECIRNDIMKMSLNYDGAHSLSIGDESITYQNSEIGMNGSIVLLDDRVMVLYTKFREGIVTIPEERRLTVWSKANVEIEDDITNILMQLCILEDELDVKEVDSECWS